MVQYPSFDDFSLRCVQGSSNEWDGASGYGYEVEYLCPSCQDKLKIELERLGIELLEVDY